MLDRIIDAVAVLSPLAIAIMSVLVGIKLARNPQDQSHRRWWWGIIGLGVICTGVTLWQQERSRQAHIDEVNRSNNAVNGIKADLQKSELDRVADTNRLQGKLDVFTQFAPAIFKLAQATEENTRKTYEAKMLSNKDLYDATMDVVKKMREFGQRRQLESVQQMNADRAAMQTATTEAEKTKVWTNQSNGMIAAHYQKVAEFRTSILPDAVYVRNELLRRKIPEPLSNPMRPASMVQMVFTGSLAGPYPEFDAADYLEQMAKQLRLK
jgi:hypothetical protein